MKISVFLSILTCIIGLGLFVPGMVIGETTPTGIFKGSEVFEAEEEYGQFKVALALTDWDLDEVKVLHSDPPILVEFRTHDATHSFPYGVEDTVNEGYMPLFIPGIILFTLGGASLMWTTSTY